MSDYARQVGRELNQQGQDTHDALNRYAQRPVALERARDIFDPVVPFEMEFYTDKPQSKVMLDLFFLGPPPSKCCSNNLCSKCEVFADGSEVITLERPYVAGSVIPYVKGTRRTAFTETSPETGVVTINTTVAVGDVVRICYVYLYEE
jgi:hypothetical protein